MASVVGVSLAHRRGPVGRGGFSLMELMAVVMIMGLLVVLAAGRFGPQIKAGGFTRSVVSVAGVFEQARAQAMAGNQHVHVGLTEVDASLDESVVPQRPATGTSGGRVVVVIAAGKDGTASLAPDNLFFQGPPVVLENLHVPGQKSGLLPEGDGGVVPVGDAASVPYFTWPAGTGVAKYAFNRVVRFDPRGVAHVGADKGMVKWVEVGLLPTDGGEIPEAATVKNKAAIQINGISGSVKTWWP